MLLARRRSDGKTVEAYFEKSENAPFACLECNELVVLKCGRSNINHFAHVNPLACNKSESEKHFQCKHEIYTCLLKEPKATQVALEKNMGVVRPDVSAVINGVPVAIEVQISSLSIQSIMSRTIAYHQMGIYVLWILLWNPKLEKENFSPSVWEKWIHACYFGRVYYWTGGLNVTSYHFEPALRHVPRFERTTSTGRKERVGGYVKRSTRLKRPIRGKSFDISKNFRPRKRFWWSNENIQVPDANLFMEEYFRNE